MSSASSPINLNATILTQANLFKEEYDAIAYLDKEIVSNAIQILFTRHTLLIGLINAISLSDLENLNSKHKASLVDVTYIRCGMLLRSYSQE